jgi:hypothetical protein
MSGHDHSKLLIADQYHWNKHEVKAIIKHTLFFLIVNESRTKIVEVFKTSIKELEDLVRKLKSFNKKFSYVNFSYYILSTTIYKQDYYTTSFLITSLTNSNSGNVTATQIQSSGIKVAVHSNVEIIL